MAMYLFQLNKRGTTVLNAEAAKLCPELAKMDSKELLFIVLYVDYNSPYSQMSDIERIRRAKRQVWGTSDVVPEQNKKMIDAIEMYKSLQYDPKRETLRIYNEKIFKLSNDILHESDPRQIGKLDEAINTLQKRASAIEKELNEIMSNDAELKGGQRMSFIEKWQENMREYNKIHQREMAHGTPKV